MYTELVTFRGKAESEHVLFHARLHWIVLLSRLLSYGILGAAGSGVIVLLFALLYAGNAQDILNTVSDTMWLLDLWFAGTLTAILYAWMTWYLSIFIITDRRLLQIVQNGLFSHYSLELKLENVRDSAFSYNHPLHYIFNYGTLFARSATGAIGDFQVPNISNPRDVHHYVHKLITLLDEAKKGSVDVQLPPFQRKWGKKHMKRDES